MTMKEMEAEIARLNKALADSDARAKAAEEKATGLEATNKELTEKLGRAAEKDAAATEAIAAIKIENDKLKGEAKTAHERAVEILAATGHPAPIKADDQSAAAKEAKKDPEKKALDPSLKGRDRVAAAFNAEFATR